MYDFINNDLLVVCDVDDTLIMHSYPDEFKDEAIQVPDCYDPNNAYTVVPHKLHIKVLKDFKARGYHVIVWSAAGAKHAKTIVDALGLQDHVNTVMSKPIKYMDDLEAHQILGARIYLKDKKK